MNLILIGPPGAGKGTQAERITSKYSLKHLSSGDLLRQALCSGSDLGGRAKEYMDKGELVPDDLVVELVKSHMPPKQGVLLDGFPRTLAQAQRLDSSLSQSDKQIDAVIILEVDHSLVTDRMLARGRQDDTLQVIEHRLQVFVTQTVSLCQYYQDQGKLLQIDGNGSVNDVSEQIFQCLGSLKI